MIKPDGIQYGDRVRITFEGVAEKSYRFLPDGAQDNEAVSFMAGAKSARTFTIEKLEKPLEPGEQVRHKFMCAPCDLLHVAYDMAFIRWRNDYDEGDVLEDNYVVVPVRNLERV